MTNLSLSDAIDFVSKNSPASTPERILSIAYRLVAICNRENEPKERAWIIEKYWEEKK